MLTSILYKKLSVMPLSRYKASFLAATLLSLQTGLAHAAFINISPASGKINYDYGETATLNVDITGLDKYITKPGTAENPVPTYAFTEERLAAFDLDLVFEPSKLTFTGGTFGTGLGSTLFDTLTLTSPGQLKLSQLSTESIASLLANQPRPSFTLAVLSFTVNLQAAGSPAGVADVTTSRVELSDEKGDTLTWRGSSSTSLFGTGNGIKDDPLPTSVPIPAAWILFSAGFAFVEGGRRWFAKKR